VFWLDFLIERIASTRWHRSLTIPGTLLTMKIWRLIPEQFIRGRDRSKYADHANPRLCKVAGFFVSSGCLYFDDPPTLGARNVGLGRSTFGPRRVARSAGSESRILCSGNSALR
jgi:hypothetical protein